MECDKETPNILNIEDAIKSIEKIKANIKRLLEKRKKYDKNKPNANR